VTATPQSSSSHQADALRALHAALRSGRRNEALAIARSLRDHYRRQGGPAALLRFVDELLADTEPVVADGDIPLASGAFRLGAARDGRRLAAVLALWRQLCPGEPLPLADWPGPEAGPEPRTAAGLDRNLALAAQADGGQLVRWHDGWFRGATNLHLRLEAWPDRPVDRLVVCQSEAGRLHRCAQLALPRHGAALMEAPLRNPFLPVLLAVLDADGLLLDLSLLPFPSLLRHGLHHAERCAAAEITSTGAFAWDCLRRQLDPTLPRIATLELPPDGGNGSEQLCRPAVSRWLRQVWGLKRIRPGCFARGDGALATGLQLKLAGDGIPSLRALSGLTPDENADPGAGSPFLLVDPADFLPLTLCRPGREPDPGPQATPAPALSDQLLRLQPQSGDAQPFRSQEAVAVHLAVEVADGRYPLLVPTVPAPGDPQGAIPELRVLLLAGSDPEDLHYSLWGLIQQRGVRLGSVEILTPPSMAGSMPPLPEEIATCFPPGCLELAANPQAPETLTGLHGGDERTLPTLVLRAGICLHQPRTLAQLHGLLTPADVVSASCLLVREQWFEGGRRVTAQSCGLHPEEIRLDGPSPLTLVERDLLGSLGLRDLSVLAPVPDLVLLDTASEAWRRAWRTSAPCNDLAQLLVERSVEAVLAGGLHRCSARFSASYRRPPPPERHWWLPERLRHPLFADLPRLLRACSLVQRLEP